MEMPEKTAERDIRIGDPDSPASDAQWSLIDDLYAHGVISKEELDFLGPEATKQEASDLIGAHSQEDAFKAVQDARKADRDAARAAAKAESRGQNPENGDKDGKSEYANVKMPHAFLHPHTLTTEDGRSFEKAYVHFPQGTKVNGIDLSGYSCDVFLTDYMKQQMLAGEQVTLGFKADELVPVWTGTKGSEQYPYKRFEVSPWDLVKGIKAANEEFKTAKAAEREAAKEQGGVSLAGEAKASRDASSALAGRDAQEAAAVAR